MQTPVEGRPLLAEYCRAGWHLVPIPLGQKGPVAARWNVRELTVSDPAIAEWLDGNVGLAHAYSNTCAIDIDDLAKCSAWLGERGINLARLLDAPEAVRIESRPGRAKLLYALPKPMPSFKLGSLELRCATSTGLTVQDVLPPSIHPDTGRPYEWAYGSPAGHWSLLPPLPPQLAALWQQLIAVKAPKAPHPRNAVYAEDMARLREILEDLDPDASYEDGRTGWIAVGMALHHETRGTGGGLALWNEWSSRGKKYQGLADLETHWRSFRLDHESPRTLASLRASRPAQADEFKDLTQEPSSTLAVAPGAEPDPKLPPPLTGQAREKAIQALRGVRRTRNGTIEARISNIVSVLGLADICGSHLSLDQFQDAIMIAGRDEQWRPLTDSDYVSLRIWLETVGNCDPISHEMIRHAVALVAEQHKMDSAQIWLKSLTWDGVPRIECFCPQYLGTFDTEYERAVGLYLWTALAARIADPGCQADMVPVLIGRQGVGKSTTVQSLVPSPDQYVELRLDEPDDVIARKLRGVLVAELAEMRGLRAADVDRVKAFITRRHERWVPKFKEFATNYARRSLIIGTTNDEEFLPPDTEHRRWLPLHVDIVNTDLIKRDREQLWAEGYACWQRHGIHWRGADTLAAPARQLAAMEDNWAEQIAQWLHDNPADHYRMADIMTNAIGLDHRAATRAHELRVARALHGLGYARRATRVRGRVTKVWMLDPTA